MYGLTKHSASICLLKLRRLEFLTVKKQDEELVSLKYCNIYRYNCCPNRRSNDHRLYLLTNIPQVRLYASHFYLQINP